jgi:predicted O-methyltransferase YrrM
MSEYQFTKDWFGWAPPVWEQLIPMLPERKKFLEIGSFEGRSTVWIVENMMEDGGFIDCIDTWQGGEEHGTEDMDSVEKRFDQNVALLKAKFPKREAVKLKGSSVSVLAGNMCVAGNIHEDLEGGDYDNKETYDFIYIDGSHIAKDVLTDACMAWPLLKPKGIMVFDDYVWGDPRDILHRPKVAIDAFTNIFAEEVEVIHVGYQLVVRKKGE